MVVAANWIYSLIIRSSPSSLVVRVVVHKGFEPSRIRLPAYEAWTGLTRRAFRWGSSQWKMQALLLQMVFSSCRSEGWSRVRRLLIPTIAYLAHLHHRVLVRWKWRRCHRSRNVFGCDSELLLIKYRHYIWGLNNHILMLVEQIHICSVVLKQLLQWRRWMWRFVQIRWNFLIDALSIFKWLVR